MTHRRRDAEFEYDAGGTEVGEGGSDDASPSGSGASDELDHASTLHGSLDLLGEVDLARVRGDVHARLFGRAPDREAPTEGSASRGARIGRYVLLEPLGRGATAVVYAAYDPELDRRIALKLLRPAGARGQRASSDAPSRMLREAQALAKLSHPNVVTVHDVGAHDGGVFVAMERVQGPTLRGWMRAAKRSWVEVVDVMLLAGRGLAAAHAVGILHRDFKPENVMLRAAESDGRADLVCVTDFGLARLVDAEPSAPAGDDVRPRLAALELEVTETGALLGTPAYMAPEQFSGAPVDARTDQFAFCAATWEALFGARPFEGGTVHALATRLLRGDPPRPPAGTRVPGWLTRALLRGLSCEPSARWPDMNALLTVLSRGRTQARRRRFAAVGAGLCVLAIAGLGAIELDRRQRRGACARQAASIDAVWNDDVRAELRTHLQSLDTPLSRATPAKLEPWLDATSTAWSQAQLGRCVAAEVDGVDTPALHDAAQWCLAERRVELSSLIDGLRVVDAADVGAAVPSAATLPSAARCGDPQWLARAQAPDVEHRDGLLAIGAERTAARHDADLGRRESRLRALLQHAEALAWAPTTAAVRIDHARALVKLARFDDAEHTASAAFHEAARFGAWDVAADAALEASSIGLWRRDLDDAAQWLEHASTAVSLTPAHDEAREARLRFASGALADADERPLDAQRGFEAALATYELAYGPEHPEVARVLTRLGILHRRRDDYGEMLASCARARDILVRSLGVEHPEVASATVPLVVATYESGDDLAARPLILEALEVFETTHGQRSEAFQNARLNLARIEQGLGHGDEALAIFREVLAARESYLGPRHLRVGTTLRYLAELERARGDLVAADAHATRAVEIAEAASEAPTAELAIYLQSLARVREARGALAEAEALHRRAIAIAIANDNALGVGRTNAAVAEFLARTGAHEAARAVARAVLVTREAELGPEHPLVARMLTWLGELDLEDGRDVAARPGLERAVAIFEHAIGIGQDEHDAAFALARAVWRDDPLRARSLAEAALAGHRAAPGERPGQVDAIQSWLATHPGP